MHRPITDLALQHILQSGLAVVRGEPVEESRRSKVLQALVQIFTDADRGSQALGAQNLLLAVEEPPAFERFVLLFRYLNQSFGQDLPARLSEAASVLTDIEKNAPLSAQAKTRAAELLEGVLAAIAREGALRQLAPPREVQLSF